MSENNIRTQQNLALIRARLASKGISRADESDGIPEFSGKTEFKLSAGQRRIWLSEKVSPGTSKYNIANAYEIKGELRVEELKLAVSTTIKQYRILNIRITENNQGEPRQAINTNENVLTNHKDLSNLSTEQARVKAFNIAREEAKIAFDLNHDKPIRVTLIRINEKHHILSFTIHHIAFDAWSSSIFVQNLITNYLTISNTQQLSDNKSEIDFLDFAQWENESDQQDKLQNQLVYWKKYLSGSIPRLNLPHDRSREKDSVSSGKIVSFALNETTTAALKELAINSQATLNMVLLSCFKIFLYRLCDETDIVVASPTAGRTKSSLENMVGYFSNTVVIRTQLKPHETFIELLAQVKRNTTEVFSNQDVSFEKVVNSLSLVNHSSRNPIFDVMFSLENVPASKNSISNLEISNVALHNSQSKFDLTLFMTEANQTVLGSLEYNTAIFDRETAENFVSYFNSLIQGVIAQPQTSFYNLPLFDKQREATYLKNAAGIEQSVAPVPVHQLFKLVAQKHPDKCALIFKGKSISYGDLMSAVTHTAKFLRNKGIGTENRVVIYMQRSPELVVAVLAILECGGAYVPIDVKMPLKRIKSIVDSSNADLTLTQPALKEITKSFSKAIHLVSMEDLKPLRHSPPPTIVTPSYMKSLAYVIYTSGSTGTPKGVEISHESLSNYLVNCVAKNYPIDREEIVPLHTSLSFDLTVTSLLGPLVSGGTINLLDTESEIDALANLLKGNQPISYVKITPAHMEILGQILRKENAISTDTFVVGGEALSPKLENQWMSQNRQLKIINEYGPTEATVGCCIHEISRSVEHQKLVPIGRPITNARLYVLDEFQQLRPHGVAGELFIGGIGLARGYANNPAETASTFLPDPFSTKGCRMYRTGDRVKVDKDGQLTYIDRKRVDYKHKGYRIDLKEIELALLKDPAVDKAIIHLFRDDTASSRLLAFVKVNNQSNRSDLLKESLASWLPQYMIPDAFVFVNDFPVTANGKIDIAYLLNQRPETKNSKVPVVLANTKTEVKLVEVFERIFNQNTISITQDFFEAGGNSMMAAQLSFHIRQQLDVDLPLSTIFENTTIQSLAKVIQSANIIQALPILEKANKQQSIPLSSAQKRLWFLNKLQPEDSSYNISYPLKFEGALDVKLFKDAIKHLVLRHEILRTRYPEFNGQPEQIIQQNVELPFENIDLSGEEHAEISAISQIKGSMGKAFSLTENQTPLRVLLFKVSKTVHYVAIIIHHIACDALSIDLMVKEIIEYYKNLNSDLDWEPKPLKYQYADYATWQQQLSEQAIFQQQLEFWKSKLSNSPPALTLPTDYSSNNRAASKSAYHSIKLPADLKEQVEKFSSQHSVTMYMLGMSVFQTLMYRYSSQRSFIVGSPVTERNNADLQELIGLFLNVIPIVADLNDRPSMLKLIERVKKVTLESLSNSLVPFEQLVEEYAKTRSVNQQPLFQVMFTYQKVTSQPFSLPNVDIKPLTIDAGPSRFDITAFLIDSGTDLTLQFEYDTSLFCEKTIVGMSEQFQTILEEMIRNPNATVDEIEILQSNQKEKLVNANNSTLDQALNDELLHDLIVQQAVIRPDALAVQFEETSITYAQLNEKSNQLCQYLLSKQVKKEDIVAVLMNRSPEVLISILAVLKCGAAYLPLDPSYPSGRISFMLEDSGAKLVLTQRQLLQQITDIDIDIEAMAVDSEWDKNIANNSKESNFIDLTPDNIAYLIYTSGSSGRPKATMVSHRSIINHAVAMAKDYQLDHTSRFSQFFSLSFDGSAEDLYPALISGACILCSANPTRSDLSETLSFYSQHQITHLHLPTAIWHFFSSLIHQKKITLPDSLKLTSAGGEALSIEHLQRFFKATEGRVSFMNVYGPTETTVTSSTLTIRTNEISDEHRGNLAIGKPLRNTKYYVLDQSMNLVPNGIPGELYIAGMGVARGYRGQSGLTAEKFVPNPFDHNGQRMYKTGDLVRYDQEGNLHYLTRIDQQVKIGSVRIELSEIQSVLSTYVDIKDCVITTHKHKNDTRVIAYYVSDSTEINSTRIREFLAKELPLFMLPAAFIRLTEIPITENGKVDQKKLVMPDFNALPEHQYVAPTTDIERKVAKIWQTVLGNPRVGIDDNFFEIGGHSWLMLQLHDKLQTEFSKPISLIDLFQFTTVRQQSTYLDDDGLKQEKNDQHINEEWAKTRRNKMINRRRSRTPRRDGSLSSTPTVKESEYE